MNTQEYSGTLDLAQAADFCKCSTELLCRLARNGAIPATKVGRRWVFPTRLLQEWIDHRSLANTDRSYPGALRRVTITQALTANGSANLLDRGRRPTRTAE
jgi:excisionase family DNA binding protein